MVNRRFGRNRRLAGLVVLGLSLAWSARPCWAALPDEPTPDPAALSAMEHQADGAKPREQCMLYTQVVHGLTELAGKELEDGQESLAAATLEHVEVLSRRMEKLLLKDAKQLKNAEMLMEHTTRRLKEMLHLAPGDNRLRLQATLDRLTVEQNAMLNEVFAE